MVDYRCYYCKETKDESLFNYTKGKHRPVSDGCKECVRKQNRIQYEKNKQKRIDSANKQRTDNPDKVNNYVRNSRIRTEHGNVIVHNNISLNALIKRDKGICGLCKKPVERSDATRDHKTPLSRGGLHSWDNVHLAHRSCNAQKGDMTKEEWIERVLNDQTY